MEETQMLSGRLTATAYIILGMLMLRDMSGYDLKVLLDKSVAHFYWSPAKSQIYTELRRLAAQEYVAVQEVPQQHRPDKWLYGITPKGRAILQQWLEQEAVGPDVFKSPFLLRIFFGHLLDPAQLIAQVEIRRQTIEAELALCKGKEWELLNRMHGPDEERTLLFPLLTLRYSMASLEAALAWSDAAIIQIQQWQRLHQSPWREPSQET